MFYVDGQRKHLKLGVVIPSTNWIVEAEIQALPIAGVSFHYGRMHLLDARMDTDERFEAMMARFRETIGETIASVMTCEPDYLLMGMSSETFWNGVEGAQRFVEQAQTLSGLSVTSGAFSVRTALDLYDARRLGVVTPYQPVGDAQVERFLTEAGYDVVNLVGLKCESALAITRVTEDKLRRALYEADGPDVDALLQVGTNLSMIRLADEAERWLGKPVIAINAANIWHALRASGIQQQFDGFGSLLRFH
jgi:maleate isomerase